MTKPRLHATLTVRKAHYDELDNLAKRRGTTKARLVGDLLKLAQTPYFPPHKPAPPSCGVPQNDGKSEHDTTRIVAGVFEPIVAQVVKMVTTKRHHKKTP